MYVLTVFSHVVYITEELKERNNSLVEENEQLKNYIGRLLLAVIEHSPEVLEVKASASAPPNSSLCDFT